MGGAGGNFTLHAARVIRQPGDGNCLYHALAHGLGSGTSAGALRRELAEWVKGHPTERIADTPLSDWVLWDSGECAQEYARRMARSGWGGGIEMAACARLRRVNIHVYERKGGSSMGTFKRISCFDVPRTGGVRAGGTPARTLHVLYCGGVHYDALEPAALTWQDRL
jgi:hypothetical protein